MAVAGPVQAQDAPGGHPAPRKGRGYISEEEVRAGLLPELLAGCWLCPALDG